MKVLTKLLVVIFFISCICYYFDINVKDMLTGIIGNKQISGVTKPGANTSKVDTSSVTIPEKGGQVQVPVETKKEEAYDEIIKFIINQKKDRKLIESYRVLDKAIGGDLKGRSYITDNAIASVALINDGTEESKNTALQILKDLSSIQNDDGSWYDFYDITGQIGKLSGKDYKTSDSGNNSLVLYAFSFYTNSTGDEQFRDVMKKCANFILSRTDNINNGLYDTTVGEKGTRSIRANAYAYFGLRDYAFSNMNTDYNEYKQKLNAADNISGWIMKNCYDKGVFIKGYTGKDKMTGVNLDAQLLGAMVAQSVSQGDNTKYGSKELVAVLGQLYKNIGAAEGYMIDNSESSKSYIWGQGTSKASIVLHKYEEEEKSKTVLENIKKFHGTVSKNLVPRGVPHSSNLDSKIDLVNLESVSSSAWAAIAFQCALDDGANNMVFGQEEYVFSKLK